MSNMETLARYDGARAGDEWAQRSPFFTDEEIDQAAAEAAQRSDWPERILPAFTQGFREQAESWYTDASGGLFDTDEQPEGPPTIGAGAWGQCAQCKHFGPVLWNGQGWYHEEHTPR